MIHCVLPVVVEAYGRIWYCVVSVTVVEIGSILDPLYVNSSIALVSAEA